MFSYLMISNKLLLLSMKQIRRDSMNNLNNLSYVRVTDALDSTPGSAVVSTNRSTIDVLCQLQDSEPTLDTIHVSPLKVQDRMHLQVTHFKDRMGRD